MVSESLLARFYVYSTFFVHWRYSVHLHRRLSGLLIDSPLDIQYSIFRSKHVVVPIARRDATRRRQHA